MKRTWLARILGAASSLKGINKHISEHGLAIINVLDGELRVEFSYSVGLAEKFNHPELIVSGLPSRAASGLLNACASRIQSGERFSNFQVSRDLLNGELRCAFMPVLDECKVDLFAAAFAYYRNHNFKALQVIWPDRAGLLPREPGYQQGVDIQDLFFDPNVDWRPG